MSRWSDVRFLCTPLSVLLFLAASALAAQGEAVLDQQQTVGGWSAGSTDQWQSFTAGKTGLMSRLDVNVDSGLQGQAQSGTIRIYEGEGTGGRLLATQAVTFQYGRNQFQSFTFQQPAPVVSGQMYSYRLTIPSITVGWVALNLNNPYPRGRSSRSTEDSDLLFRTYVLEQPAQVDAWALGALVNNSTYEVSFSFPVAQGATATADALRSLQSAALLIPDLGVLSIEAKGHDTGCSSPSGHAHMAFGERAWELYYDNGTTLGITVNADATFGFQTGAGGQIKNAGERAACKR